ncbi:MAG: hypothetical protein KKD25_19325 [Gammaproteobacteria bacterium]|jgi:glutathione synthase/RimK-type ligase-like ATP-grasp enzyme|nr:hypothetical protein [Gammaproteobacteria bacterium]MBU0773014.1 hypothetical protein [Gammaproteobacteria bacterium]MBU0856512.1 hypothetical protein [Gammaproteobacteria bacterium]MBU1847708.1 hypothetical protein [Gammaproteobacteria bacterium]
MHGYDEIALVTARDMPTPDDESQHLISALNARGLRAAMLPWDGDADWSRFRLVVVRSPWDYHLRLPEFLAWTRHVAGRTRLLNPAGLIEWNSHKRYLGELARAGIAVVPTWLAVAGSADAQAQLAACGWADVVVKPAVSIGAWGALHARADDAACSAHLAALLRDGDALIQPFMPAIERDGEMSLVFFGGRYSHAVRKLPRQGDFRCQDHHGGTVAPHAPEQDEFDLARAALAATPEPAVFARVDMIRGDDGPRLIELEVIEPALFFAQSAPGTRMFAELLARLARAGRDG